MKKSMPYRGLMPWLAGACLALCLSGCLAGGGANGSNDAAGGKAGAAASAKGTKELDYLNETGFPIVNKPIKLKIFVKQASVQPEFKDIYLLKKYEEMTGIHTDWITVPASAVSEKLSLAMASKDMPDVFMRCKISPSDQLKYGEDGAILDLNKNGLLQKYAPNFCAYMEKYPDVKQSQTFPGGAIYSIPAAAEDPATRMSRKLFYNQEWLTALGLKQPTNIDELYQVLKAFKTRDPNGNGKADEIPISQTPENIYETFMGMFGLMDRGVHNNNYDIDEKTGKIRHIRTAPEYREMLTFLNKLYKEGIIDQECFTYKDQTGAGLVSQDRLGMIINTNLALYPASVEKLFVPAEQAIKGPHGDQLWPSIRSHLHSSGAFVISADCKHPEAALRWVDYFYSDEGVKFYHYGIDGDTCVKNADGSYSYTDKITSQITGNASYDQVVSQYTPYSGGNNPTIMKWPYFSGAELAPLPKKAAENLMPYTPKEVWPFFTYTDKEQKVLLDVGSPINQYCQQTSGEFLTGQRPLDDADWDEYVATVKKMGLDQVLAVEEAAYARTKGN